MSVLLPPDKISSPQNKFGPKNRDYYLGHAKPLYDDDDDDDDDVMMLYLLLLLVTLSMTLMSAATAPCRLSAAQPRALDRLHYEYSRQRWAVGRPLCAGE